MFRASSCLSSRGTTTAVADSGLPSELGGSSAVGRGRAGRPARLRPTASIQVDKSHIKTGLIRNFSN